MDTSKEYIKMADCPEVQGEWTIPPYPDDYCYRKEDERISWGSHLTADIVDEWIFLPRQDQIQEMMGIKTAEGFRNMVDDMFYTRDIGGLYDTMDDKWFVEEIKTPEQLWLAFYMFKNHQKIWNGDKWIKSETE